jgi:prepilin-type N-terminal cleavage/methylation domain-containing protein
MNRRGFTLVEMSVVITILVILAALITPNLVTMQTSREVRSFVNALPDIAGRARDTAISEGVTTKLTYDDASHSILLSIEKANEDDTDVTSLTVPTQVQVTGFQADGETRSSGDWTVRFYSDGRSDGGGIETSDAGMIRSLVVDKDGVAKLQPGQLPEESEDRWPAGEYEHRA